MILLEAAGVLSSAPFSGPAITQLHIDAELPPQRTLSTAGSYAVAAVARLNPPIPQTLVCLCGPTGSTSAVFDPARDPQPPHQLLAPGFNSRSRRIHPFTLLVSLQNQVAAGLSIHFGIRGQVLNAVGSWERLIQLLPNLSRLLQDHDELLLVLAADARRHENLARFPANPLNVPPLAGAIAFRIASDYRPIFTTHMYQTPDLPDSPASCHAFLALDPLLSPAARLLQLVSLAKRPLTLSSALIQQLNRLANTD